MPKALLTAGAINALKPGPKPYAVATGIKNLRVHVSPAGTKTFQLRRGGTMLTLGRCDDMALAHAQRMALSGETPAEVAVATRTIGDWIALYKTDTAHLASNQIRAQAIKRTLEPLLKRELPALSRTWLIQRCNDLLKGGYKPRSVRTYRTNICMLLNWIVDQGGLPRSPMRKLPTLPINRTVNFLDTPDVIKLVHCCQTYPDVKVAAFCMIGLHAGLRRGEILSLEWPEVTVDAFKPQIHVLAEKAKTLRERRVPINRTLLHFLLERRDRLTTKRPFFFHRVDYKFRQLRVAAGLSRPATPHWLRATFASMLLSRKRSLAAVSELLGHKDTATTAIYLHALQQDYDDATSALDVPLIESMFERAKSGA